MYRKSLQLLLLLLSMTNYQLLFAHGGGGGSSSYDLDKKDLAAEREAEKKAAEKKQDKDTWADFMKAVNKPKKGDGVEKNHGHHEGVSGE